MGEVGGQDYEVFLYDGMSTTQLTNNFYMDLHVQISDGGMVVWCRMIDYYTVDEIYLYDGTRTIKLTSNSYNEVAPQINAGGEVVWHTAPQYALKSEIFLARPSEYPASANSIAASCGSSALTGSRVSNELILLLLPMGAVVVLRILRRKR